MILAKKAFYKVHEILKGEGTILDIGCGTELQHAKEFDMLGYEVDGLDIFDEEDFAVDNILKEYIQNDFSNMGSRIGVQLWDCLWCSHTLEHQRNVGVFLDKMHEYSKTDSLVAITVPPRKDAIVGGHVSLWNAGLLLYNLVLSGFDCSRAMVTTEGYNVSVVVEKADIREELSEIPLEYNNGDIFKLKKFFPPELFKGPHSNGDQFFGVIKNLNW